MIYEHCNFYTVIPYSVFLLCLLSIQIFAEDDQNLINSGNIPNSWNSNDPNGFGDLYEWHGFEDGLKLARESGKPLMVIFHKPDCTACKELKSQFSVSESTLQLSKNFILVNVLALYDEHYSVALYPDGKYVPRILFLDSKGVVHTYIYNEKGNPQYKYFYHQIASVDESMKSALSLLRNGGGNQEL